MDLTLPPELEELIICSCCHLPFNDHDSLPKLLACRHHFCLKCVNSLLREGSDELYCMHCWKRTELQGSEPKTDNLTTYTAILYLTQNLSTISLKTKGGPPCGVVTIGESNCLAREKLRSSSIASNSSNGGALSGSSVSSSNNTNSSLNNNTTGANELGRNNSTEKLMMGENCMTHAMPNTLWCTACHTRLCRACAGTEEHRSHPVKNQLEAKESIHTDINNELVSMQKTLNDVHHLVLKQRDFLLKILECCTTLKTQIETELINHMPTLEIADLRESFAKIRFCLDRLDKQTPSDAIKLYGTLHGEKQQLLAKYQQMFLQCKLDDLIRNCCYVLDFDLIKQTLIQVHNCVVSDGNLEEGFSATGSVNGCLSRHHNPVLLLANYCISQLYSTHMLVLKQQQNQLHQQQLLSSTLFNSTMISNTNNMATLPSVLNGSISNRSFTYGTYAQALQQNQPSSNISHLQSSKMDTTSSVQKTFAEISLCSPNAKSNKTILHAQQQTLNEGFPEIAPIGTSASISTSSLSALAQCFGSATLFSSANDLNNLSLSLLQLQHLNQAQQEQQQQQSKSKILLNPGGHVYPIYFLNIEINGQPSGRILIEVRSDVAPKMAKNFNALATHELGYGYKGCHIFQCWENESIITGDFELNNGRGGRSVYDEGFFMPDDTKILAIRGSVGMRRSQKRHDNLGLVGSQFRIILREMRGFTGIFAFVVEGLELVEKISQGGDATGKPQSSMVIVNCGRYQQLG